MSACIRMVVATLAFSILVVIGIHVSRTPVVELVGSQDAAMIKGMGCYESQDYPCSTLLTEVRCSTTKCDQQTQTCDKSNSETIPNTKKAKGCHDMFGSPGYPFRCDETGTQVDCGTKQGCAQNCNLGQNGTWYCAGPSGTIIPQPFLEKAPAGPECTKT